RDYAAQVVRNAKALAHGLHERGIRVLAEKHGFTESHAIALDVASLGGGAKVAGDLEKANIITNKNLLPWDTSRVKPSGIRLDSTCSTIPTNASATPVAVLALAYDQGHRRCRKNDSISAGGRARSFWRSALLTTPYVGMSPATERIERAHSSRAMSVSRRVR